MPKLTPEKQERLRLHAEQILETQRRIKREGVPVRDAPTEKEFLKNAKKEWKRSHPRHWTHKRLHDYATWMVRAKNAMDLVQARLRQSGG